jgi:CRISPR-associated endonuclease Cas1
VETGRKRLKHDAEQVFHVDSLGRLNALEANATKTYYAGLRQVLPPGWGFDTRNRRPPKDPFNVLLSLGYSILYAHTDAMLRADGLQPALGLYHQPRPGHAALASDLMEPFRHLVERCALRLVRKKQLDLDGFVIEGDACRMNNQSRRFYLEQLQEVFTAPVMAAGGGDPATLHGHLHRQNLSLIAWLREENEFTACLFR